MYEPLSLSLEQTLHWDTRRAGHNTGDIIRRDALAEHGAGARALLTLELRNRSVAQTRRSLKVALALCDLQFMFGFLEAALAFFVALQPLALCSYIR